MTIINHKVNDNEVTITYTHEDSTEPQEFTFVFASNNDAQNLTPEEMENLLSEALAEPTAA